MAIRMPFGKFKGKPLDSIPRDYLEWILVGTREPINPYLAEAIKTQLARWDAQSTKPKKAEPAKAFLKENTKARYYPPEKNKPQPTPQEARDWLNLPENAEDYQVCMEGNVQEMAAASECIRQRWEAWRLNHAARTATSSI